MSTYPWAQLLAGSYGLPGPAVVTSPWVLEVRAPRPRRRGFTHVTDPRHFRRMRTARRMVADYSDPWDVIVVSARRPAAIDPDGLRNLTPGAADAGGTHWLIGSPFHGPGAQAFHDQVHQTGRLLLLTGDLHAYWSAARDDATPSFGQLSLPAPGRRGSHCWSTSTTTGSAPEPTGGAPAAADGGGVGALLIAGALYSAVAGRPRSRGRRCRRCRP